VVDEGWEWVEDLSLYYLAACFWVARFLSLEDWGFDFEFVAYDLFVHLVSSRF
jgi:hypothetical protein